MALMHDYIIQANFTSPHLKEQFFAFALVVLGYSILFNSTALGIYLCMQIFATWQFQNEAWRWNLFVWCKHAARATSTQKEQRTIIISFDLTPKPCIAISFWIHKSPWFTTNQFGEAAKGVKICNWWENVKRLVTEHEIFLVTSAFFNCLVKTECVQSL